MALEIELKLTLPVRAIPQLRQYAPLREIPSRRQWVGNSYLDTPDRALWKERIGVRRRQIKRGADTNEPWLLTVKSQGIVTDGISRRSEWEFPMPPDRLDFSGVEDATMREWLTRLAPQLRPVFCVNFVRQSWHLSGREVGVDESQAELALDFGYIRAGVEKTGREAFCEVELELLEGDEALLARWGERLCLELPELRHQAMSKAGRGYALLLR